MSLEIFVVIACLSSPQCDKAMKAYYAERPNVRQQAKIYKRKVTEVFGETLVTATPATIALAMKKTAQFKIYGNYSLQISEDVRQLIYTFNF